MVSLICVVIRKLHIVKKIHSIVGVTLFVTIEVKYGLFSLQDSHIYLTDFGVRTIIVLVRKLKSGESVFKVLGKVDIYSY